MVKLAGGEDILSERTLNPQVQAEIRAQWKLDEPLWVQYRYHMGKLLVFDSIESRKQRGKTLRDILAEKLPTTVRLGMRSFVFALGLGVPIGVLCAVCQNRFVDQAGRVAALVGVSVPSFILASAAIYLLSREWGLFPATEWHTNWWRFWIPALCLGAFPFAAVLRLTRASMLEALREDYVRTARAKGVDPWRVVIRHALRNALGPVVTYSGPIAAGVLTGSLVVERIFSIPGLGADFVNSVSNRDMPLIMGLTVFYCALLVFFNLLVDVLYPILNPRLRD
jgi:ABC-type dipeptide/oligopeptide/nickel transport system permease component